MLTPRMQGPSRRPTAGRALRDACLVSCFALSLSACQRKDSPPAPAEQEAPSQSADSASGASKQEAQDDSAAPPVARGAGLSPAEVLKVVNPAKRPAYEGPTGSVEGRVVVVGDAPLDLADTRKEIPASCAVARETFGSVFREGMQRSLGDALVAVTGYSGYVPAANDSVTVEARGCAWQTRTVALTYGQRIDVVSKDQETYVPELMGQPWPVQLVAVPGGKPVSVPPRKPGHYVLIDSMRLFNKADVYVLPYATFTVTGLDGRFKIDRIPPGPVKVNALLPATGVTVEKEVTVRAGEAVTVELEMSFDREAYERHMAEKQKGTTTSP